MNRKNRILIPLILAIALLLAACQGEDTAEVSETAPAEPTEAAVVEPTAEPSPEDIPTEIPEPEPTESAAEPSDDITQDSLPGRIALVNPDGELVTIDPTGDNARTISEADAIAQFPAWSPTGQEIAVIETFADRSGIGIRVYDDVEGDEAVTVYESAQLAPIYLYWFPDGEQVSFIARDSDGLALHLAPADGSSNSRVLSSGQPFYWQWLSNNKQALIHVGTQSIAFLDLEGNEVPTGLGRGGTFQTPAMSSDSRYFAYQEGTENGREIQIKDLTQDELVYRAEHEGFLSMAWHPNDDMLAFVDTEDDQFLGPLLLVDLETGEASTVVGQNVVSFFWSPDGRYIAFLTPDSPGPSADGDLLKTVSLTQQQQRPVITLGLVDVELGTTQFISQFEPTGYFVQQFLPFYDQYALSHRVWSPDSRALVFPANGEGNQPVIQIFPIDGGDPITIADGISAFWSHE